MRQVKPLSLVPLTKMIDPTKLKKKEIVEFAGEWYVYWFSVNDLFGVAG